MSKLQRLVAGLLLLLTTSPVWSQESETDEVQRVWHLLNRATYGATPELADRLLEMGRQQWIEEQLHPELMDMTHVMARLASFETLGQSTAELLENYPAPPEAFRPLIELQAATMILAVHSPAQLQEVLVDFWINHFNVYAAESPTRWTFLRYLRDQIRPRVMGNFEELLVATARSAAMMYYLDNYQSFKPLQLANGRSLGLNENYARELLELHTMGVGGGYSQEDVIEVARALTGWSLTSPRTGTIEFTFYPELHEEGPFFVLGETIDSGGIQDGLDVLSLVAHHPSTARFISKKLAARFLADDPPEELIDALSEVFLHTGGDLRELVRALLVSDVFYDPEYFNSKVKAPMELVTSSLRALQTELVRGDIAAYLVSELGQPVFLAIPPTGYKEDAASVTSAGTVLTTWRLFAILATGQIPGFRMDLSRLVRASSNASVTADRWMALLLGPTISESTVDAIRAAAQTRGIKRDELISLILSSPEFLHQ